MEAAKIIETLELIPHPEGGHYRETWRDEPDDGSRGVLSLIYYLLCEGERSHWHWVDAVETWHYYAGAPIGLGVCEPGDKVRNYCLGSDILKGQQPQAIVPAKAWQSAVSMGAWTLVGCSVAPAFSFDGFEMAPPGWEPGRRQGEPW